MTREAARGRSGAGTYGIAFWTGLVVGGTVVAYAVWGVLQDHDATNPPGLLKWVAGLALLHDALVAPVVTIVGLLLAWALPARVRGPVVAALAVSALVTLFSVPLLRTFGKRELNSSTLPLDYGRNLAIVLGVVWTVAAVVAVVRVLRDRA